LAPFTTSPVSAVFDVQPTPLPWSARHSHVLSPMVLGLLTTRLSVALPTPSPPIRKCRSCTAFGSAALFALAPAGPRSTSVLELVGLASISRSSSCTPPTSAVEIAAMPFCGWRVARPMPRMIVFGWVTVSVWLSW